MRKRIKYLISRFKWMITPKIYKQQIEDLRELYMDEQEKVQGLIDEIDILIMERDEFEYKLDQLQMQVNKDKERSYNIPF